MSNISPLAIIEEGAKIGNNVKIAPFCFVSKESEIGDNTSIAQGATIYGKTKIGKDNEIFSYAVLGSKPQDLKFKGEDVELIIGDRNKIREFTLFNPGTSGGGSKTIIGDDNLFMGYVHIAHDCIVGNNCVLANGVTLGGHVEISNGVVIGGLTPVHQFVKIGEYAMVAGASAVGQDVPPYCLVEGNRASIRGLNLTGLRRVMTRRDIDLLKQTYTKVFKGENSFRVEALELLENETHSFSKKLLDFISLNTRGISLKRDKK